MISKYSKVTPLVKFANFRSLLILKIIFLILICIDYKVNADVYSSPDSDYWVLIHKKKLPLTNIVNINIFKGLDSEQKPEIIEIQGDLRSAFILGDNLHLSFESVAYTYNIPDKKKNRTYKALSNSTLLSQFYKDNQYHYLTYNSKDKNLYLNENTEQQSLVPLELSTYKSLNAKAEHLFIETLNQDNLPLIYKLHFDQGKLKVKTLPKPNFKYDFITTDNSDGIILLNQNNEAYQYNNFSFSSYRLPQAQGQAWTSVTEVQENIIYLAENLNKSTILFPNGKTLEINHESTSTYNSADKTLLQQFFISALTISLLILLLNLRIKARKFAVIEKESIVTSSLLLRSLAFFMDLFIVDGPIRILFNLIFGPELDQLLIARMNSSSNLMEAMEYSMSEPIFSIYTLFFTVLFISYHLVMEYKFSGSLGKIFLNLKVVDANGQKPNFIQLLKRNTLRVIDMTFLLGLISCLLSKDKQSLGDRFAKTYIVKSTLHFKHDPRSKK